MVKNNGDLKSLRNLGPAMEKCLHKVGVKTPEDLFRIGAVDAYLKIRASGAKHMNKMALYALYGAIYDMDCTKLPHEIKQMLKAMLQEQG